MNGPIAVEFEKIADSGFGFHECEAVSRKSVLQNTNLVPKVRLCKTVLSERLGKAEN